MPPSVHVWSENVYEPPEPLTVPAATFRDWRAGAMETYPDGIHGTLGTCFVDRGLDVTTATLADPDQGFPAERIEAADVLVLYANYRNDAIEPEVVSRVTGAVNDGLGLVVLHSGRKSPIFTGLMGTSAALDTTNESTRGRLLVVEPEHPIVAHLDEPVIEFERLQGNGEPFRIPPPERVLALNWTDDGRAYRSACCYTRGAGRIFYFGPGHETCPIYHDERVQDLLTNAVRWAAWDPD